MDEPPRNNFNYGVAFIISVICFFMTYVKCVKQGKATVTGYVSNSRIRKNIFCRPKRYFLISGGPC